MNITGGLKRYCYFCDKDVPIELQEKDVNMTIKGTNITYHAKVAYCEECKNEVYVPELDGENIKNANQEYRKSANLVSIDEIQSLLDKYQIGKKPLARLLGWGETTIERYLDGITPLRVYSEELRRLKDPKYMKRIYEENKEALTEVARKKIEKSLDGLLNYKPKKKVDIKDVINFFLSKIDDAAGSCITPLKLQKLLFYAQGWYMSFFKVSLFANDFQAWVHGPVIPEVYFKFRDNGYHAIDKVEADLSKFDPMQVELLKEVYDVYGMYDAKVLERMTHRDAPWKEARQGYGWDENCQEVILQEKMHAYFDTLKAMFDIQEIKDIRKCLRVYQEIVYI